MDLKSRTLYRFSPSFYYWQLLILVVSGVFFLWFAREETMDHALTSMWFDPVSHSFPLQNNRLLELINHQMLKYIVIGIGGVLLIAGLIRRQMQLVTCALLFGLGAAVVGALKSFSLHSCPWDLVEYGGQAIGYPLLSAASYFSGPGHCFPGGHASSGFGLMALFFLIYPKNQRLAWWALGFAVVMGLGMGYGQVMRGAHFFSHNLWTGWWVWATQVSAYGLLSHGLPLRHQQAILQWTNRRTARIQS
jgi:membrane-associated PAP2 superfamily phosphatase